MIIVCTETLSMKHSKLSCYLIGLLIVSVITIVTCLPTNKPERGAFDEFKVEKHMPNGTVIGKYSYKDKEGNPTQIKYYADDSSYGVELKSFKKIDVPKTPVLVKESYAENKQSSELNTLDQKQKSPSEEMESEYLIPYSINKRNGLNRYKPQKPNSDFDVFYQNELNPPQECGKEKVHIYFDKEKKQDRKGRSVFDDIGENKYCEKF